MSNQISNIDIKIEKSIKQNNIIEKYLLLLPILKNCKNWLEVKEITFIDHNTKNTKYYGLIVKYHDKYYFLEYKIIASLSKFRKWDLRKTLKVKSTASKTANSNLFSKKYL